MSKNENRGCLSIFFGWESPSEKKITYPYKVSQHFLTPSEHSFFLVARKVLGDQYMICPQVALSAIFFITGRYFRVPFQRISQKRIDFLVCDAVTMKSLFGIELDDSSHKKAERTERDDFINNVFQAAGLPLLRVPAKNSYNTEDLQNLFRSALHGETNRGEVKPVVTVSLEQTKPEKPSEVCPKCGAMLSIRVSTSGPNQGRRFQVCTKYPECKTAILVE